MFRNRLENLIDMRHELVRLGGLVEWGLFEAQFGPHYAETGGCPARPVRLMVGLQYLKHIHGLSDEAVVSGWVENPYWQHFCGEVYFRHDPPIDPSSMTRFRKRIGEPGCELLLKATIGAGVRSGTVRERDFGRVTVDTTVQEKAVSFPTDSKLLNRSRERLARLCAANGVKLRQSYARKGPEALLKANRYAHAKQMKRMRREVGRLRTFLGRVVRDIRRKTEGSADLEAVFAEELGKAERLLAQKRDSKNKLYSLHAPEVECISKGKAHRRYEFGVKAGIATTNRSNFVVGGTALPGNPYDGHTLLESLNQVRRLTGRPVLEAYVDRGYRGHGEREAVVYISGQKRGVRTMRIRKCIRRRQAVEPVIGHLKSDGLMGRNWLKGRDGDQMNVLLSCAGHNMRLILRKLRGILCALIPEPLKRPFIKFLSDVVGRSGANPVHLRGLRDFLHPRFAAEPA